MLGNCDLALLEQGAKQLNIDLNARQLEQFSVFAAALLEWNEKFNLTRITDHKDIVIKHFLDSLTCLSAAEFPLDAKVVDVGVGAGFPGLPMEIARPDLNMTLLDSTRKRLIFIGAVSEELGLGGIRLLHARAEEAGRDLEHRDYYDAGVARAVAKMNLLAEYCLPLIRVDGFFVAQKGSEALDELADAEPAILALGGDIERIVRTALPYSDIVRNLVVIRKVKPTPDQFPRRPAVIQKNPL